MFSFVASDTLKPHFLDKKLSTLWSYISPLYITDEAHCLKQLMPMATPNIQEASQIEERATALIQRVRKDKHAMHMIDALLLEYSLDTKEGILLMCLAEALMRIPDPETANALIKDKLSVADWAAHLKKSDSVFVNASTWGLLLTGKVINLGQTTQGGATSIVNRLVNKMTEPVIREAMHQAMKIMGHQFVLGRHIEEAQKNAKGFNDKGISYSFDMLGESALTATDAKKYFTAYLSAIESIGAKLLNKQDLGTAATVSIKLSALHPRYEVINKQRVLTEMFDTVVLLIEKARSLNVGLTIDAEEADRLELSLILFEKLYRHRSAQGWGKLGLVIQAYSKRALPSLVWLAALAKEQGDVIPLRLVKGAYWDSELKLSQQQGYAGYPVYTRKEATDVSYLACARFLLSEHVRGCIYPQFASHNAHTVAAVATMATHNDFEFQRLHGMGDTLYNHVVDLFKCQLRIYAPVGSHKDLLPYLVRRLLENGANSSFVHRLVDANCPIEALVEHPVTTLQSRSTLHNGLIVLPSAIFPDRKNSHSVNIDIESEARLLEHALKGVKEKQWQAGPIVDGVHYHDVTQLSDATVVNCTTPYDRSIHIGHLVYTNTALVEQALATAQTLVGCDQITQQVSRQGKGVFVCISPWNFPLAIFLGQISAALISGNTVIAKPAEQTSLIAVRTVLLMLEAGFPKGVIQLLTGLGRNIGPLLTEDERIAGVVFTGSTTTAQSINRSLAKRPALPATLIAETGGQNAMIVDSTALPEQVARDVIRSAFASAGQRCSALRVLFVQQDIAERVIELIKGAMQELSLGLPDLYQTDVGPVIDKSAKDKLTAYIEHMLKTHSLIAQVPLNESCRKGDFVTPVAIEINHLSELKEEQFGPILHVIRYKASELPQVIDQINATDFGLTMGIHSRNEAAYGRIADACRVGNCYINRDQVGAVVGVQPFGGQGLSGTGPKAGGPHYLYRFTQTKFESLDE